MYIYTAHEKEQRASNKIKYHIINKHSSETATVEANHAEMAEYENTRNNHENKNKSKRKRGNGSLRINIST